MAKRKIDKEIKTQMEAISYTKSLREKAPSNPKLTEDLGRLEKKYHDELFELMDRKISPEK